MATEYKTKTIKFLKQYSYKKNNVKQTVIKKGSVHTIPEHAADYHIREGNAIEVD